MLSITITFHFWSLQLITITQKTVIDCNQLQLMITIIYPMSTIMHQYTIKELLNIKQLTLSSFFLFLLRLFLRFPREERETALFVFFWSVSVIIAATSSSKPMLFKDFEKSQLQQLFKKPLVITG